MKIIDPVKPVIEPYFINSGWYRTLIGLE